MFVAMAMKHLFLTATIKLLHPHFAIAMMLLEYSVKRVIICNFCLNNGVSLIGLLDNTKGPFNCTDGDVKLFGGSNPYKGTLHICVNKAWSTVCWRNNWQSVNTAVVCQQLGYTAYGTVTLSPPYFPLSFSFSCFPLFYSFLLFLLFAVIICYILFIIKVISIHLEGQMRDILPLLLD